MSDYPEGWLWPVAPMQPARLLGGERNAVIVLGLPCVYVVFIVAHTIPGSMFGIGMSWIVAGLATAVWFGGLALLYKLWTVDPWMLGPTLNGTYFRSTRLPKPYMASHATLGSDGTRRSVLRSRSQVKR